MKLSALTLLFSTIFYLSSNAQGIDFGTKIGLASTAVKGNNTFSDKNRYSYQAGAYLAFEGLPLISIQSEFLYNRTRFKMQNEQGGLTTGLKKMGYWSVPVLVQLRPVSFIRLGAGPQWNFHTNSTKYKMSNGVPAFKDYLSFVVNAQLKLSSTSQLYFRYNKGIRSFENLPDGTGNKINRIEFGIQQSLTNK